MIVNKSHFSAFRTSHRYPLTQFCPLLLILVDHFLFIAGSAQICCFDFCGIIFDLKVYYELKLQKLEGVSDERVVGRQFYLLFRTIHSPVQLRGDNQLVNRKVGLDSYIL
jgi:hypothetical protein